MVATRSQNLESLSEDSGGGNGGNGKLKDPSQIYFGRINHSLLTANQEIELAKRINDGITYERMKYGEGYRRKIISRTDDAKEAISVLVRHNLKLVVSIAKKYMGQGLSFQDLVQEGNIGLTKAANGYKGSSRFSTYATWGIHRQLWKALKKANKANKMYSLDDYIAQSENLEHRDLLRAPKSYEPGEDPESMQSDNKISYLKLINRVDNRTRHLLRLRYRDGMTLVNVGEELGVSKERVRQLQNKGIRRLKEIVEREEILV